MMTPLLYRVDQVSALLQMSRSSVIRRIKKGELIAHNAKVGSKGLRVVASSVEAYIKKYQIVIESWNL